MAHFAQLDEINTVLQVIVVSNDDVMDNGQESEAKGISLCQSLLGSNTNWAQTSYNATFRKNYAGIGYTFDAQRNAFIPPKPFNSWILDEETCQWNPPVAYPDDTKRYMWNEEAQQWDEINT